MSATTGGEADDEDEGDQTEETVTVEVVTDAELRCGVSLYGPDE